MISITPSAAAEIHRMQTQRQQMALRLTLNTGSCEQFYYVLNLVDKLSSDDVVYEVENLTVGIDRHYSPYLENVQIDFAQDLMGGGFRFGNPQALKVCGCGNAFTAKFPAYDRPNTGFEI